MFAGERPEVVEVEIADEVLIEAPPEEVWKAISDPAAHAEWHPFVTSIDGEHRLGATRTCSVLVGKKAGETTERCIREDEGRQMTWLIETDSTGFGRMVSDWRAGFVLDQRDGKTLVRAQSGFEPRNLLVRLLSPIIRRKFHQTQREILAALKQAVESRSRPTARPPA